MANHYYGVSDTGSNKAVANNVTVGTSSNSVAIELVVLDGQSISKARLLAAIEAIWNKVATSDAPA